MLHCNVAHYCANMTRLSHVAVNVALQDIRQVRLTIVSLKSPTVMTVCKVFSRSAAAIPDKLLHIIII